MMSFVPIDWVIPVRKVQEIIETIIEEILNRIAITEENKGPEIDQTKEIGQITPREIEPIEIIDPEILRIVTGVDRILKIGIEIIHGR